MQAGRRAGKISRQICVERGDGFAQAQARGFPPLAGMRPHHEGANCGGGRRAEQRHIETGVVGLVIEWTLHQRVGNDADDRAPGLRLAGLKMRTRRPSGISLPQYFCANWRSRSRPAVSHRCRRREIATLENLQSHGGEVAVRDRFRVALRAVAIGYVSLAIDFVLTETPKVMRKRSLIAASSNRIGAQRANGADEKFAARIFGRIIALQKGHARAVNAVFVVAIIEL